MDVILTNAATIAIVMIILNMIVEKIVSFWKLNGSTDLIVKNNDPEAEKRREMKISNSTLIVGILIALFLKVDFIAIVSNNDSEQTFGWDFITLDACYLNADSLCKSELKNKALYSEKTREYFKSLRADIPQGNACIPLRFVLIGTLALTFFQLFVFVAFRKPKEGRTYKEIITPRRSLSYSAVVFALIFLLISISIASFNNSWLLFYRYCCIYLSAILAGAGVSFGSKFWHDLLDLILHIKNFRKTFSEMKQPMVTTETPVEDEITNEDIQQYINAHLEQLKKDYPYILGAGAGYKWISGTQVKQRSLVIYVKHKYVLDQKDTNGKTLLTGKDVIPKSFSITKYGKEYFIPTDIIETGVIERASGDSPELDYCNSGLRPGIAITYEGSNSGEFGTFGCVALDQNNKKYLLTCSHVLNHKPGKVFTANCPGKAQIEIGNLSMGKFFNNNLLDIAAVEINQQALKELNDEIIGLGYPEKVREVFSKEIQYEKPIFVFMSGARSGQVMRGEIVENGAAIEFKDGRRMIGLIATKYMVEQGDSGALLLDSKKGAIGICVATDQGNNRSFFMPIAPILSELNISLYTYKDFQKRGVFA